VVEGQAAAGTTMMTTDWRHDAPDRNRARRKPKADMTANEVEILKCKIAIIALLAVQVLAVVIVWIQIVPR
jgi:hypothetical protein